MNRKHSSSVTCINLSKRTHTKIPILFDEGTIWNTGDASDTQSQLNIHFSKKPKPANWCMLFNCHGGERVGRYYKVLIRCRYCCQFIVVSWWISKSNTIPHVKWWHQRNTVGHWRVVIGIDIRKLASNIMVWNNFERASKLRMVVTSSRVLIQSSYSSQ